MSRRKLLPPSSSTMTRNNRFRPGPLGLYVHIPFCIRRCLYCAFYSQELRPEPEEEAYVARLLTDMKQAADRYGKREADSLYIGGGTPSLLSASAIGALIEGAARYFSLSSSAEITMEANPGTLNRSKAAAFFRAGINRLSLGFQSFDDRKLRFLGRIHTGKDCERVFEEAREAGFENINCDLIFAVPGQTPAGWEVDLTRLIKLKPEHISFYSLQLEEGTPLFSLFEKGVIREVPDEEDRTMYHRTLDMLEASSYEVYEISNAAKAGYACRHNLKYWSMQDYLGFGASASSYIDGVRFTEAKDLYPDMPFGQADRYEEYHVNSSFDDASEFVFTGLRRREGISFCEFRERFGADIYDFFPDAFSQLPALAAQGFLVLNGEGMKLSQAGIDISNRIMALFV